MTGDQPQAVDRLVEGLNKDFKHQTLLGVTGSGKTFTMANVIERVQRPTLVICHNKTLAAQLSSEFREFFPENAVEYFVSYYDYYQPEAYVPRTDTYIEKEVDINDILTLKVRVSGSGNFKTLNVPQYKTSDFYKIYPAKISRDVSHRESRLTGYAEAEVPVSFKKAGLISFPPLEFQYFDPAAPRVVSLNNPPIMVKVTGTKDKEEQAATLPKTEIIKK